MTTSVNEDREVLLSYQRISRYNKKSNSFETLDKITSQPGGLEVNGNHSFFSVFYTAENIPENTSVKFEYQLEGYHDTWIQTQWPGPIQFAYLPKGDYFLKLRVVNEEGTILAGPEILELKVIQAFFQSKWFLGLAGIIILIGIVLFAWYRILKISQEKETLEIKIEQRTSKIRLQKEKTEKAYNKLNKTYDQLHNTYSQLKEMQLHLIQSEKLASLGQLTAGVAHELNNPINFIYAGVGPLRKNLQELESLIEQYQQLSKAKDPNKKIKTVFEHQKKININALISENRSIIDAIEEGARRTKDIVTELRQFTRGEEGKTSLSDIHEGLDSTLMLLKNEYKGRILITKAYKKMPLVECYPGKLNQVFMNIFTNAFESIQGEGEILIKTWATEKFANISIMDSGQGMDSEVEKKIFEPFFTTKDVGKGMGLGLSVSFGIIRQHNGKIEVSSVPGKGTTIQVSIPFSHDRVNSFE